MAAFKCGICLNVWPANDTEDLRSIECGHIFCDACLQRLLTESPHPRCPNCRAGPVEDHHLRRVFPSIVTQQNDRASVASSASSSRAVAQRMNTTRERERGALENPMHGALIRQGPYGNQSRAMERAQTQTTIYRELTVEGPVLKERALVLSSSPIHRAVSLLYRVSGPNGGAQLSEQYLLKK